MPTATAVVQEAKVEAEKITPASLPADDYDVPAFLRRR